MQRLDVDSFVTPETQQTSRASLRSDPSDMDDHQTIIPSIRRSLRKPHDASARGKRASERWSVSVRSVGPSEAEAEAEAEASIWPGKSWATRTSFEGSARCLF